MNSNKVSSDIKPKQVIDLFWKASLEHKKNAILSLALPISQVILGVGIPFFASKVIANVVTSNDAMKYFWMLLAFAIAGLLLNYIGIRNNMIMQARTMASLHRMAYQKLLLRSVGFFNNNIGGKLVSDAVDMPNSYSVLVNNSFIKATGFILTVVTGLIVLLLNSPMFALMVLTLLVVVTYLTVNESKKRSSLRKQRIVAYRRLTSHLSDTIVNAPTVKAFGREKFELDRSNVLNDELADIRERDWVRAVSNESFRVSFVIAMQVLVVLSIILISKDNPAAMASGIFAFTYSINITSKFFELNTITRMVEESLVKAAPMIEIMQEDEEVRDKPGSKDIKVSLGEINIDNVSFKYSDGPKNQTVIKKLNINIKPSEKIGLVGHSGGGKSTLTKLLLRFEDINEGSIEIDGQNINDVTQLSLHQSIAYVPQEPLMFHRSIRENIGYGKINASKKDIVEAAKRAHADTFIDKLEDDYDTIVGERGVKLSGGQRQRIAIARAILKDSPILLLDEATSALDSESEKLIQKALEELMKNKTTIVIAHRLSTIQKMDKILVLEDGQIKEQGNHNQLLANKGTYAELWSHQSGGFIEE